jgi:hypothetical protein
MVELHFAWELALEKVRAQKAILTKPGEIERLREDLLSARNDFEGSAHGLASLLVLEIDLAVAIVSHCLPF